MNSPNPTIGAIDIGSNAIRLLIAQVQAGGELVEIEKVREPVRLGGDVFADGSISDGSMSAAKKAFGRFEKKIKKHKCDQVLAVATSAVREAKNKQEFVTTIADEFDIDIEIIDFVEEAELVQSAVMQQVNCHNQAMLIMDIGGGSIEFVYSRDCKVELVESFPFGTVRTLNLSNKHNITIREQVEKLRSLVEHMLSGVSAPPEIFVGTGGNMVCMGGLRTMLFDKNSPKRLKLVELESLIALLESLSVNDRQHKLGMRPDRADVILPACYVTELVMDCLGVEKVVIPRVGIREGMVLKQSTGS